MHIDRHCMHTAQAELNGNIWSAKMSEQLHIQKDEGAPQHDASRWDAQCTLQMLD